MTYRESLLNAIDALKIVQHDVEYADDCKNGSELACQISDTIELLHNEAIKQEN